MCFATVKRIEKKKENRWINWEKETHWERKNGERYKILINEFTCVKLQKPTTEWKSVVFEFKMKWFFAVCVRMRVECVGVIGLLHHVTISNHQSHIKTVWKSEGSEIDSHKNGYIPLMYALALGRKPRKIYSAHPKCEAVLHFLCNEFLLRWTIPLSCQIFYIPNTRYPRSS